MTKPLLHLIAAAILTLGALSSAAAAPASPAAANGAVATAGDPAAGSAEDDVATQATVLRGERWIEIILSQRRLIAREGKTIVLSTIVSLGKPSTPTVRGTYRIYAKMRSTRMSGPGYSIPNVPYVMYFRGGYAIHGAPWASRFGGLISHGCVNVPVSKAAWLFNWAPAGTRVVIR